MVVPLPLAPPGEATTDKRLTADLTASSASSPHRAAVDATSEKVGIAPTTAEKLSATANVGVSGASTFFSSAGGGGGLGELGGAMPVFSSLKVTGFGAEPMSMLTTSYEIGGRPFNRICFLYVSMPQASAWTSRAFAKLASFARSMWHSRQV